ncbi:MAG TPA: M56 family metallopeptidase [Flavisolibacter sp.]|nr:M56 family metallopeptidase [Flavisolibacter sp.]
MASWSQSHFLQSLGWATLNSFWQMALLWCIYLAINATFKISSDKKYRLAVGAIVTGFLWFVFTFVYYFNSSSVSGIAILNQTISESNSTLNTFLLSASIAYLSLLVFPTYRLFRNWQFVQRIKKQGLQKSNLNYRLFVQKVSSQLNIGKKVFVYISELVTSPVTVGYLKPIILIPVAALSNLSTQQVEAILLHELSHIRRYDYLVNFIVSIISTFLYFNPFVKQFIRTIEEERENCCDQLVLQYGYDKVGYASALLTLEKLSTSRHVLVLGAAGKKYLLSRIEKIVGMEQKKGFKRNQFAGLLAALFCIIVFNSILIIKDKKENSNNLYASVDLVNPFNLFEGSNTHDKGNYIINPAEYKTNLKPSLASNQKTEVKKAPEVKQGNALAVSLLANNMFVNVAQDDVDASLTKEQKEKVKSTVDATKKVLGNLQWKEVETVIADVLTEKEKQIARQQYLNQLKKADYWKNIEQNMKAQYNNMDWQLIDTKMNNALAAIKLDSLEKTYTVILNQLNKVTNEAKGEVNICPLPDQSIEQIKETKEELSSRVNTIKALRSDKKVVRL